MLLASPANNWNSSLHFTSLHSTYLHRSVHFLIHCLFPQLKGKIYNVENLILLIALFPVPRMAPGT